MAAVARQRVAKGRTSQSSARPAAGCRSALQGSRAVGPGLLDIDAPSLSLPRTSSAVEGTGPAERSQTGIHGQTSAQSRRARPHVCCDQGIVDQRGRQPGVARAAAARARAWVSRKQFGNAPCTWNIDSIVCCRTSWLTCTSCSCQTGVTQSDGKLRKSPIQPWE